jgi:hypothetical protein
MKNGCILCGGVGSGKSRTSIAYYFFKVVKGRMSVNGEGHYHEPYYKTDLYIITTAAKRDSLEWDKELMPFLLSQKKEDSICNIKVVVDSWNNIKKYANVKNAFFIFDEDRVCGKGAWAKNFIRISKNNGWILLSATPGDTWSDYIPVFIANGFYKNRTEFNQMHVVFSPYVTKFPMIDRYVNTKLLERERESILIDMEFERPTTPHNITLKTSYEKAKYKSIMKDRWDPFDNEPIENVSKLCYLLRKVSNTDMTRIDTVRNLIRENKRCIIFYNFDYELDILRQVAAEFHIGAREWNGHRHDKVPDTDRWVYLCQYTSAAEGWNCITTNVMIFYSLNYSYKTMIQAAGRIDRLNTSYKDLYYYYLRSNSPIDLAIMSSLKRKKKFNERNFIERNN